VLVEKYDLEWSGYLKDDSFSVKCTITVLKEIPDLATISGKKVEVPSSNFHEHLWELLKSETGANVTFVVSGESFAAHTAILFFPSDPALGRYSLA
jgi:speckle-type POZ protein